MPLPPPKRPTLVNTGIVLAEGKQSLLDQFEEELCEDFNIMSEVKNGKIYLCRTPDETAPVEGSEVLDKLREYCRVSMAFRAYWETNQFT